MNLIKIAPAPKFDRTKGYGEIYGSGGDDGVRASYVMTGGHYFAGNGDYVGTDSGSVKLAQGPLIPQEPAPGTAKQLLETEVEELLKDPRATEIMQQPLETLSNMVRSQGGPVYSGDNALRNYTAWLIKFVA